MLTKNPITLLLYEFDYDGTDNIYEYWINNRNECLSFLSKKNIKKEYSKTDLKVFEYKVRWASHFGFRFRFYIQKFITKQGTFNGFENIPMNYGGDVVTLDYFIDDISKYVDRIEKTDLRGLSLIDYKFKDFVIEDVDFSYASLDYTSFEGCIFKTCIFCNTSFYRCKMISCEFQKSCTFSNNDFSRAVIDSEYDCLIYFPKIKIPRGFERVKIFFNRELYPLSYTKISSKSFINNCNDRGFRNKLKNIYNDIM